MTAIAAGLMLGLAGSIHCVAMCGPLVLTVRHARDASGVALYHAARVLVYVALGLVAGLVGHAVSAAGFGRALSVVGGIALIAIAVGRAGVAQRIARGWGSGVTRALSRAMQAARTLTDGRPRAGVLTAGALNALLPCGLLYAALAGATAMATLRDAFAFMAAFGIGTIPALAALPLAARSIPYAVRSRLRFAAPAALAVVGAMLVMRGMHH